MEAPEALSKATLMGSWQGASPNFITLAKVGVEGCQAKPQKRLARATQNPGLPELLLWGRGAFLAEGVGMEGRASL